MTTVDSVKAMFDEILAKMSDGNARMTDLEDKVVSLSFQISSVKADQGCLHVTVNNVKK
jgi:hypothetical protein